MALNDCSSTTTPASLESFVPDLTIDVPGSEMLALRMLRRAADEFYRRSMVWRVFYERPVMPGRRDYELIPALLAGRPVRIHGIYMPDLDSPSTDDEIELPERREMRMPDGSDGDDGVEQAWYSAAPDQFLLARDPDRAMTLRIWVSLTIKTAGNTIPGELSAHWREAILAGAKARLMMVPGQSYTEPNVAQLHQREFEIGVERAMHYHNRDQDSNRPYYGRVQELAESTRRYQARRR